MVGAVSFSWDAALGNGLSNMTQSWIKIIHLSLRIFYCLPQLKRAGFGYKLVASSVKMNGINLTESYKDCKKFLALNFRYCNEYRVKPLLLAKKY